MGDSEALAETAVGGSSVSAACYERSRHWSAILFMASGNDCGFGDGSSIGQFFDVPASVQQAPDLC